MGAARGRLEAAGTSVVVQDEKEANALYNKGAYGVPQSGGRLRLDLEEALHLVESGRLDVAGHPVESLLRHASRGEPDFEIRYLVYRDLRKRTFVVKRSGHAELQVYPRGGIPGRSASSHLVQCASERGSLDARSLVARVLEARKLRKALLVALVDEEGDLTYYEARVEALRGDAPPLPPADARAILLDDRVMVLDRAEGARLVAGGFFGRDVGVGHQLAMPEAAYLLEHGRLRLADADGTPLDAKMLAARAARLEPDFDLRRALYAGLRQRGIVVKTGLKYGTHFRAYLGAPDEAHAPYLVHGLAPGRLVPWAEVAGFVRLAHGVRKRLFFATMGAADFDLLELARRKP